MFAFSVRPHFPSAQNQADCESHDYQRIKNTKQVSQSGEGFTGLRDVGFRGDAKTMLREVDAPVSAVDAEGVIASALALIVDAGGVADGLAGAVRLSATAYGVADRVGSLEVRKDAEFFVCEGDTLATTANMRYLFIGGQPAPVASRFTMFLDKYMARLGN